MEYQFTCQYWASGSHSPAATMFQGKPTFVYRDDASGGGDEKMYYAQLGDSSNDDYLKGPYSINGMSGGTTSKDSDSTKGHTLAVTDHRPAICTFLNDLWVVSKANKKHFITECVYNGKTWSSNSNETKWQKDDDKKDAQQHHRGYQMHPVGNDDKLIRNQIQTADYYNPQTPRNPSITVLGNDVYVAYKGGPYTSDSDTREMYYMKSSSKFNWDKPHTLLDGYVSRYAPAITSVNNDIICLFANHNDHEYLYQAVVCSNGQWVSKPTVQSLYNIRVHTSKGDPQLTTLTHGSNGLVLLSYNDGEKARLCSLTYS